jgi:hypothetical protein
MFWSEKIATFRTNPPHQDKNGNPQKMRRGRPPEGQGAQAILVMMYLALGKDTGYKMAQEFTKGITKENGWNAEHIKTFKSLKSQSQLDTLLKRMEEEGFLTSEKSTKGRRHKYFRLNPAILRSPDGSEKYYCESEAGASAVFFSDGFDGEYLKLKAKYERYEGGVLGIPDGQINEFLHELKKENRESYFHQWSKYTKFDLETLLWFLNFEASKHDKKIGYELHRYIGEVVFLREKDKNINKRIYLRPPLLSEFDEHGA